MTDQPAELYQVRLIEEPRPTGESTWFAEHPDLPHCHAVGRTQEEALANLDRTRTAWLQWARAHQVPIPPPPEDPAVMVQYAIRRGVTQAKQVDADLGVTFAVPA